jgi:molybdopterin converting factor small subunit
MPVVRLFAVLREIAGESFVEVDGGSVEEVVQVLCDRFGERFTAVVQRSTVVVGNEKVALDTPLSGAEEVALLPPVAGG